METKMAEHLLADTDKRGVATVTLNRPDKHNAFNDELIADLMQALSELGRDDEVRVVVLTGAGKSFSSGADINWMRAMAKFGEAENIEDALKLAELMYVLKNLPKPTVARINGPVFGGGLGLVACCDVAVAAETAKFAFTEVRLGLVPSVISPYVIEAIGIHQARRYFLTAEVFDAAEARRIGLIHEVAPPEQLDHLANRQVGLLLKGGPHALSTCKELVNTNTRKGESAEQSLKRRTAELIAQIRVSEEGQEGLAAFLEKRNPSWTS
jgi:methylglutaconyl-CoA hydratase